MDNAISLRSRVAASPHQVSCDLEGETVILYLRDGIYFGLDAVGTSVWELLQEQLTVEEIRERLVAEYDVEQDRCEGDLLRLLEQLASRGLIEVQDAVTA